MGQPGTDRNQVGEAIPNPTRGRPNKLVKGTVTLVVSADGVRVDEEGGGTVHIQSTKETDVRLLRDFMVATNTLDIEAVSAHDTNCDLMMLAWVVKGGSERPCREAFFFVDSASYRVLSMRVVRKSETSQLELHWKD